MPTDSCIHHYDFLVNGILFSPQEKKWIGTNLRPVEMDGRTVSCIEGADEGSTVGTALSTGYEFFCRQVSKQDHSLEPS